MSVPISRARRGAISVLAAAAVAGLTLSAVPQSHAASPATSTRDRAKTASPVMQDLGSRETKGFYDARGLAPAGAITSREKALKGSAPAQIAKLRALLGPSAVIDIDPLTGTPANLTALDRFLTGPSSRPARSTALSYVRGHLAELGLRRSDLSTLQLRRDYVDPVGTHHLSWTQSLNGVPVFGNGLEAHVTKDGRLIAIQGSPVSGLGALAAGRSTTPALSATMARNTAVGDVGSTAMPATQRASISRSATTSAWSNGDTAGRVWFVTTSGLHLAWDTFTKSVDGQAYTHVVDAHSGAVLYRRNLIDNDRGDAKVYDYYPGAAHGGKAKVVNFFQKNWLTHKATWLQGPNVSAWADVNDDNLVNPREKTRIPGKPGGGAQFTLRKFHRNTLCSKSFVCTWNPNKANSWQVNRKADVTNAFYLANNFHDYLARKPIGFTARAGNFERADGDSLNLNALDGADTNNGLPDGNHIDNANMLTPPDGTPPTMQMYLWHFPHTANSVDPFVPMSGAFDASILYHEYTHGLSNRLVVDAQGNSTLNAIQSRAMGEAWSDYYAMDYLVTKGFSPDSPNKDGQVLEGKYTLANKFPFRTMAMDCKLGSKARNCTDPITGKRGGYTYGDFPLIGGAPEVHSSGEVWSQTMWDIREALGHRVADSVITRGMELSANDPTMLDMRNAIIQADKVAYASAHTNKLWSLFANRGMGWYAGTTDAGDTQPSEDFHTPPDPARGYGTLAGFVVDRRTGNPLSGARVTITGHPGYTSTTGADGIYQIDFVKPGRYQRVVATAPGYELIARKVKVSTSFTQKNFETRRDWAAASGGGQIVDFTGPDYSPDCGPTGAIDLSQGIPWGSTTGDDAGTVTGTIIPKFVVVRLPQPINIGTGSRARSAFKVDPTAGCGDPGSSSTGNFTIEVSPTGANGSWVTVVNVRGAANWLPRFQFTQLTASQAVAGVRYVRLTLRSPQVPDFATNCPNGPYGGCQFTDFTELEVYGTP